MEHTDWLPEYGDFEKTFTHDPRITQENVDMNSTHLPPAYTAHPDLYPYTRDNSYDQQNSYTHIHSHPQDNFHTQDNSDSAHEHKSQPENLQPEGERARALSTASNNSDRNYTLNENGSRGLIGDWLARRITIVVLDRLAGEVVVTEEETQRITQTWYGERIETTTTRETRVNATVDTYLYFAFVKKESNGDVRKIIYNPPYFTFTLNFGKDRLHIHLPIMVANFGNKKVKRATIIFLILLVIVASAFIFLFRENMEMGVSV
ncbi:hypothetical protein NEMIN01_1934 [Nematocida minor]|uniref:uncharacterized protein n=1 Tax=Nematocida minor TaxID=1912983 RepID=UPI00221F07C9|nr:uncharacterized protein NEMIN01_1934 [Nematocida minor]KAI5192305.1 hypothetical protein NEMIN01_1934 [Nematocida minor]